jgi:membrane protease YdiL (CAAX protease family)
MPTSAVPQSKSQYSLLKIMGIWIVAALPMGILNYIVKPMVSPDIASDPIGAAKVKLGLLLVGLIWLFVFSLIIVYREKGDLSWTSIRQRLLLNTPRSPKTGEPSRKLWLWMIPFILLLFLSFSIAPITVDKWWVTLFPFFTAPPDGNIGEVLQQPGIATLLAGDWGFVGLFLLMAVFNIIGEEFIFRGVLLPKANGVFGKWDWVAISVLFGFYHVHQPWMMIGAILFASVALAFPAKRYRSTWMPIIIHSMQFLVVFPMIFAAVLG